MIFLPFVRSLLEMIKRYRGCTAASLSCIIYKRVKLISTREADEA